MSTLAEIEAAADALPLEQKKKLLQFLEACVNGELENKAPTDLARFTGTLRLSEDPLACSSACAATRFNTSAIKRMHHKRLMMRH